MVAHGGGGNFAGGLRVREGTVSGGDGRSNQGVALERDAMGSGFVLTQRAQRMGGGVDCFDSLDGRHQQFLSA